MINRITHFASSPLMNMNNVFRYSGVKMVEPESLSTHIIDVQVMGYMIMDILNKRCGENLDRGLFLEKALHHDLEESLTGDITRPLKYNNPDILREIKGVSSNVAKSLYDKYFESSDEMYKIWDEAKDGKEGFLLKIVDMLVVVTKVLKEVELLNNMYFLRVAYEVSTYLNNDILPYLVTNTPFNMKATKYLEDLVVDAIHKTTNLYEQNLRLSGDYKLLDTTMLDNE